MKIKEVSLGRDSYLMPSLFIAACVFYVGWVVMSSMLLSASANNFTDIFSTNSFRGSFEWFKKLDWLGMVVQCVISVFSLAGVCLMVIQYMTSMLFLSAKGLWEEVHDVKQTSGESEMYDFGIVNMAKTWAKGSKGTGLDAIFVAGLMILPDVKRYSYFGEKSGQKFEEDITIAQFNLKIAVPYILAIFFFAMAFNGTLLKGVATTVEGMGAIADKAVSVNYAGIVDDLVNSNTGYKFTSDYSGTNQGEVLSAIQKDVYGRVVTKVRGATQAQLFAIGQAVENTITADLVATAANNSTQVSTQIKEYFSSGADYTETDRYWGYLGYDVVVSGTSAGDESGSTGVISIPLQNFIPEDSGISGAETGADAGSYANQYINIYISQTKSFDGSYFNVDEIA